MPGTYAHYAFGKEVLSHTDDEISKIISKNMDLFLLSNNDILPLLNSIIASINSKLFTQVTP